MLSVSWAIWPGENEGVELGASPRAILLKLISDGFMENVGCGLAAACWETAISAVVAASANGSSLFSANRLDWRSPLFGSDAGEAGRGNMTGCEVNIGL